MLAVVVYMCISGMEYTRRMTISVVYTIKERLLRWYKSLVVEWTGGTTTTTVGARLLSLPLPAAGIPPHS